MNNQAYVYKWTHLLSRKWYIGSRTAKGCNPNDGYICSSRIVKPLIQSNPQDWNREIIDTGDANSMRELEQEILMLFDAVNDRRSFNRSNGGGVGRVEKHTDEAKERIRQYQKANSIGPKNHMYGKTPWNKGITKSNYPELNWGGVKLGEKRPGIGGVKKGNKAWNKGGTIPKLKGRPRSPETIAKIKASKAANPWRASEEQRKKLSESKKKKLESVDQC